MTVEQFDVRTVVAFLIIPTTATFKLHVFKAVSTTTYLATSEAMTMPCMQTSRSTVKETALCKIPLFLIRVSPET
jgi:hypothetical protein